MSVEIDGDQKLGARARVCYLVQNARRNLAACARPRFRMFTQWRPPVGAVDGVAALIASPGRKLAEAFIVFGLPHHLPPGEIEILEIGCGSGRARELLSRAGYSGRYTGLDVFDRFDTAYAGTAFESKFCLMDAHAIEVAPRFDLIVSNSALEHIDKDAELLARLRACLRPGGIQCHIVPSGAALPAYLWHGFRQYAAGTLAQRFVPAQTEVWSLGGLASLMAHMLWITLPEQLGRLVLRKRWSSLYAATLRMTISMDRFLGFGAPMYAVIERAPGHHREDSGANS